MNTVNLSETSEDFEAPESIAPETPTPNAEIELDAELEREFDSIPFSRQPRYLMAQIEQQPLAFPLQWVSEIILIEQSRILPLPFYDPMLLGVFHDKGDVVPLIVAPLANPAETTASAQRLRTKRTLTAVRLNQTVGKLAGVGVVVDRVIDRFVTDPHPSKIRIFAIDEIRSAIWQPR